MQLKETAVGESKIPCSGSFLTTALELTFCLLETRTHAVERDRTPQ